MAEEQKKNDARVEKAKRKIGAEIQFREEVKVRYMRGSRKWLRECSGGNVTSDVRSVDN